MSLCECQVGVTDRPRGDEKTVWVHNVNRGAGERLARVASCVRPPVKTTTPVSSTHHLHYTHIGHGNTVSLRRKKALSCLQRRWCLQEPSTLYDSPYLNVCLDPGCLCWELDGELVAGLNELLVVDPRRRCHFGGFLEVIFHQFFIPCFFENPSGGHGAPEGVTEEV
ncbi:hypothetical protein Hamer_G019375, partial [Homarus americanus]